MLDRVERVGYRMPQPAALFLRLCVLIIALSQVLFWCGACLSMQRYDERSGIGTLVSMMLPYAIVLTVAWALFFVAWYLIGIPLGPGWPIHL